jgi:hypothetical protein
VMPMQKRNEKVVSRPSTTTACDWKKNIHKRSYWVAKIKTRIEDNASDEQTLTKQKKRKKEEEKQEKRNKARKSKNRGRCENYQSSLLHCFPVEERGAVGPAEKTEEPRREEELS